MGYRIEYWPEKKSCRTYWKISRRTALSCLFFLLFLIGVGFFWEEGETALCRILFMPNVSTLKETVEAFMRQMEDGAMLKGAFAAFWERIREGVAVGAY